jgi:hypothetical protein
VVDTSEYVLAWPPDALRHELSWLLGQNVLDQAAAELVLREAFTGEEVLEDFGASEELPFANPWGHAGAGPSTSGRTRREFIQHLHDHAGSLRQRRHPRPYWAARHGAPPLVGPAPSREQRLQRAMEAWATTVQDLAARGYLDREAQHPCVDDENPPPPPGALLDHLLEGALGIPDLWPLHPNRWDEATFYSLVEAVADLLARPRRRRWHSYQQCGWHYSAFATVPARLVYRSLVDDLLTQAGVDLRLTADGEDAGRLVRTAGDDRDELVERAVTAPHPADRDAVRHAVALFRARGAGREDKRSAVVALARVLEDRRALLKAELLTGDEGALFEVANRYDLRHRKADQRSDYDDAYLDWVFWWYLATVELTDRLLARQGATS